MERQRTQIIGEQPWFKCMSPDCFGKDCRREVRDAVNCPIVVRTIWEKPKTSEKPADEKKV